MKSKKLRLLFNVLASLVFFTVAILFYMNEDFLKSSLFILLGTLYLFTEWFLSRYDKRNNTKKKKEQLL